MKRLWNRLYGADRRHPQPHMQAGVVRHLRGVLRALVFINHIEVVGAVFVICLGSALLYVLQLIVRPLDAVAHHGSADQANHGGHSPSTAIADRIARSAASNGAHQGARTRFGRLHQHGFTGAHLARHGNLLHDRRARNYPGQNVHGRCRHRRHGSCSCREGNKCSNKCGFHLQPSFN